LEYFHLIIKEEPFVVFYHLGGSPPSNKGFTKYALFEQRITEEGQEEVVEEWLKMGSL